MDFLKTILGDELFAQVSEKINAHNGNEANKDNQIKLGNLGGGAYVSKMKYDGEVERLNSLLSGKEQELVAANGLIEGFKKSEKGNETLQAQIGEYQSKVEQLQKELSETRVKSALKLALLSENARDVGYLTYKLEEKLREQGKTLELDENDNIKGWNDLLSDLKTQLPEQFDSGNGARKVLDGGKLPQGDTGTVTVTKEQFHQMGYNDRLKFKQDNPEAFKKYTNN